MLQPNMDLSKKFTDQNRCRELAMSSSFYRRIYAEVEEVGWENLVNLGEDLTFLSFLIVLGTGVREYPSQSPLTAWDLKRRNSEICSLCMVGWFILMWIYVGYFRLLLLICEDI